MGRGRLPRKVKLADRCGKGDSRNARSSRLSYDRRGAVTTFHGRYVARSMFVLRIGGLAHDMNLMLTGVRGWVAGLEVSVRLCGRVTSERLLVVPEDIVFGTVCRPRV